MKPSVYKTARIHTYKDMILEAILYLAPDTKLTDERFAKMSKKELAAYYCYLKNKTIA